MSIWASVDRKLTVTAKDEYTGIEPTADQFLATMPGGWVDIATCGWHDAIRLTVNNAYVGALILSPDEARTLHGRIGRALGRQNPPEPSTMQPMDIRTDP